MRVRIFLISIGQGLLAAPVTAQLYALVEGVVLGAVQLPPGGRPVVFLADHPTTGGYPVVAVVDPADQWRCAQLRPGDTVQFRRFSRTR